MGPSARSDGFPRFPRRVFTRIVSFKSLDAPPFRGPSRRGDACGGLSARRRDSSQREPSRLLLHPGWAIDKATSPDPLRGAASSAVLVGRASLLRDRLTPLPYAGRGHDALRFDPLWPCRSHVFAPRKHGKTEMLCAR